MAILAGRNFRYASGAIAAGVHVDVTARGGNTILSSGTTDGLGYFSTYLNPGQYDWLVLGARIPFDVLDLTGPMGPQGNPGPQGNQGPQGIQGPAGNPTAFELRGAGPPEGNVTDNPGTYYTDTSSTNGAVRWVKATGTGNTGWKVVYGDTGNRNLVTVLENGWIAQGAVRIARVGSWVTFTAQSLDGTAATGPVWFTLPSGFGMGMGTNSLTVPTTDAGGNPISGRSMRITPNAGGTLSLWPSNLVAPYPTQFNVMSVWRTQDAWPAILPGAAVAL